VASAHGSPTSRSLVHSHRNDLGSRSAYLPAVLAARYGRRRPPLGNARVDVERAGRFAVSPDYDTGQIRTITGPYAQRFTGEADSLFFSSEFQVEPASDRMGTRLSGPRIGAREGEILTTGVVAGPCRYRRWSADRPARRASGDRWLSGHRDGDLGRPRLVAQRLPGERLRFTRVDRDLALAALREARAALEAIA